mgnify:CR=1 FL=1
MGQKTHPYGFRLGVTKTWRSRWFAKQDYAKLLEEDLDLKDELRKRLKAAGVSSVEVDRPGNKLRITIRTSRPGIIIGRKGAEIEKLKSELAKRTKREVFIDIQEVSKPDVDAQLVSESIALQLEKRVAFRRAMRKAVDSAKRLGCKGIKVRVSGRLNGAEIARSEWYLDGQLPLHTLRADIDYGFSESQTTYGVIGVKVWIYKGEILGDFRKMSSEPEPRRAPRGERDRGERGGERRERRGPGRIGDLGREVATREAPEHGQRVRITVRGEEIEPAVLIHVGGGESLGEDARRERPMQRERTRSIVEQDVDRVHASRGDREIRVAVAVEITRDDREERATEADIAAPREPTLTVAIPHRDALGVAIDVDEVGIAIVVEVTDGDRCRTTARREVNARGDLGMREHRQQEERDHGHESRAHGGPCDTVETRSPIGVGHHVLASRAAGIALREHGGLLDVRVDDGDATPSGGRSEHLRKDS